MLGIIETQAWDGAWYTRAFDNFGKPVGSKACEEGKIYIESQAWCVLGGAGRGNGRARKALEAVEKYLYKPGLGCALQYPPYSTYHLELGEVIELSPWLQGERGGLLAQQHLDPHRLDDCSATATAHSTTT